MLHHHLHRRRTAAVGALVALGTAVTVATGFAGPSAAPPHNTAAPAITGTAKAGQMLTASPGTWTGDAPIAYAYAWKRCDAKGNGCVPAPNGTGQSYTAGTASVGSTFKVEVTASNAAGKSTAASAVTPMVSASPAGAPQMNNPPTVSGTTETGKTLTAAPGFWTGVPPITYAYAWQRCDATGGACKPVPNATQATYTLAEGDAGATFRVVVTAHNTSGTVLSTSVPTAKVTLGQAGIQALPGGQQSIPAQTLALPNRLVIEHVSFSPSSLRSHDPFKVTVRVRDTRGFLVRDAKVDILGVPYSRVGTVPEQTTGADGTVTFDVRPLAGLELGRGKYLVFFVRAEAPTGGQLAGVSSRRLVQLRTGPSA